MVICCVCGSDLGSQVSKSNMCVKCLENEIDITEEIPRTGVLNQCRDCLRYERHESKHYQAADWESTQLLAICMKKINLKGCEFLDAKFVYTEPHSMRIKIELVVLRTVCETKLRQTCTVTLTIKWKQCEECQKSYSDHTWEAVVQVRQKTDKQRTLLKIENDLAKHDFSKHCMGIKNVRNGLDFTFSQKNSAKMLVEFIKTLAPCKCGHSKSLISSDVKSNTHNIEHAFSVEVLPVSKEDLMILPPKLWSDCRGFGPLVVCTRVGGQLTLLSPDTGRTEEVNGDKFWSHNVPPVNTVDDMEEFIVLDTEDMMDDDALVGDITVAKSSDLGVNDRVFTVTTHLARYLESGDTVMGHDLSGHTLATVHAELFMGKVPKKYKKFEMPEAVLIRKVMPKRKKKNKKYKSDKIKKVVTTDDME
eukprot:TRINITY_DN7015_c0_g1_i1.p1 TRINITY_DN7015_c0_g1~~TRINITY_DN7015_c0_g1_i1.p1  ORF type:complete len:432 (-),score=93.65 TRINITY_DN7015_c0_g1_i1:135-1391(-)